MKTATIPVWDNRVPDITVRTFHRNEFEVFDDLGTLTVLVDMDGQHRRFTSFERGSEYDPSKVRTMRISTGGHDPCARVTLFV